MLERTARDQLRQAQREGRLPPDLQGVDVDTLDFSKFGMQVPADVAERQNLADTIAETWFIWGPAILVTCLGAAVLFGRWRGQ